MTDLGTTWERESLGKRKYRHTQHLKRVAYQDGSVLRRINKDWQDGDQTYPHMVTKAPMLVSVASDGARRIHPTRDVDRYIEIGSPKTMVADWSPIALGSSVCKDNLLTWKTDQIEQEIVMAGHFVKLGLELKKGWLPPNNRLAFPVSLHGLTRKGLQLFADGKPVMSFNPPHVEDRDDPMDVRAIAYEFLDGQLVYTLPDLKGMSRPLVDPTLTLQPGAGDGLDTHLDSLNSGNNNGAGTSLWTGRRDGVNRTSRTLIKFDLSGLPDAAIISSVVLSLRLWNFATNASDIILSVYRQNRAWVEGTRMDVVDNPATGATWIRYDLTTNWQTAGGFGVNDCEQSDIGSRAILTTDAIGEFKDWALTPTTKAALDLGNGWLVKSEDETLDTFPYFNSSDHATAAYRPKLVVEYTVPSGRSRNRVIQIPGIGIQVYSP